MAETAIQIFWETVRDWSLSPAEGWSAFTETRSRSSGQPSSPVVLNSSDKMSIPPICVRVLYMFGGETVVFYVSHKGRTSPYHINTLDYAQTESEDRSESTGKLNSLDKLRKYFSLTIFAPLLAPNKELPALCLLSLTSLTSIFTYLSAQELCQVGQVCGALRAASDQDLLWQRLLERDFVHGCSLSSLTGLPTTRSSATHNRLPPDASGNITKSGATPRAAPAAGEGGSAKDRYRAHQTERARQRLLLQEEQQRQRRWEAHQYPALPPPWLIAHWGGPPSWAPALPPLRLPAAGPFPALLWPRSPGDGSNVPAFEGPHGLS